MTEVAGRFVAWTSALIAVLGMALFVSFKFHRGEVPLWVDAMLSYGLVFCAVLFLNSLGKQASRLRGESDAVRRVRPVQREETGHVHKMRDLSRDVTDVLADVLLVPVRQADYEKFLSIIDEAVHEVLALDGRKPAYDETGHVMDGPSRSSVISDGTHAFFIEQNQTVAGTIVCTCTDNSSVLEVVYVAPKFRGRRLASRGTEEVIRFCRLLGQADKVRVSVSQNNMRGQRFFESLGFLREGNGTENKSTYVLIEA